MKTYLIVETLRGKIIDMSVIFPDVDDQDELARADSVEFYRLRKEYPISTHKIRCLTSNRFPVPQYLDSRRLSEVREVNASELLKKIEEKDSTE